MQKFILWKKTSKTFRYLAQNMFCRLIDKCASPHLFVKDDTKRAELEKNIQNYTGRKSKTL